jgi:CRISPR type IV-associated protein Csf3
MNNLLPLRLEWELATPWCPTALGLHLDGLIGLAAFQQALQEGTVPEGHEEILADLPFGKHEEPDGWVWQASLIRPIKVLGSQRQYMTTKTSVQDFAERMHSGGIVEKPLTTVDTVRGPYKNDAFFYTVEHVHKMVAYCIGDPERIAPLLDYVTHLGKRARLDHGRIATDENGMLVHIEEDPEALNQWQNRHMPSPYNGHVPVTGRLHPPYWKGEGMKMVWRPL